MSSFDFDKVWSANNFVDIEDIGNFYLEGINEKDGLYYYLMMKTELGTTSIMSYGPIVPDVQLIPDGYICSLNKIQFNEKKIRLWISKWLNDRQKKITGANLLSEDDFYLNFKHLDSYMKSYNEQIY